MVQAAAGLGTDFGGSGRFADAESACGGRPSAEKVIRLFRGNDGKLRNLYGNVFDEQGRPKSRGQRGQGGQEAWFRGYWASKGWT